MHIREVLLSVTAVSLSHVMFWQSGKLDLLTCLMKMMANCDKSFQEQAPSRALPRRKKTRLISNVYQGPSLNCNGRASSIRRKIRSVKSGSQSFLIAALFWGARYLSLLGAAGGAHGSRVSILRLTIENKKGALINDSYGRPNVLAARVNPKNFDRQVVNEKYGVLQAVDKNIWDHVIGAASERRVKGEISRRLSVSCDATRTIPLLRLGKRYRSPSDRRLIPSYPITWSNNEIKSFRRGNAGMGCVFQRPRWHAVRLRSDMSADIPWKLCQRETISLFACWRLAQQCSA